MVQQRDAELDRVFQALSDATRRDILQRLQKGPVGLTALCDTYDMSLPALAKHVKVLESAGLATTERSGRGRHVTAQAKNLREAAEWINRYTQYWSETLDRFAECVANEKESPA